MKDYLIRGTSLDGGIRFFCCTTKEMTETARKIHDCSPVAIAALGRMLTAGSMMGAMLKSENDKLTLQINGKGPIGSVVVVADSKCNVKGYLHNPKVETYFKGPGKLDVGKAIGVDGVLTVIKDLGLKEPYVGQIPIVNGEIGDDLTSYFVYSEQIPTSVGLGVYIDKDGDVKASGGFIIQIMPKAEETVIDKVEQNLMALKSVTEMLNCGMLPEGIIKEILGDIEFKIIDKISVNYLCDCSKQRIEKALISLGESELNKIIDEQQEAEITCHFCNHKYCFDREQLLLLLDKAKS